MKSISRLLMTTAASALSFMGAGTEQKAARRVRSAVTPKAGKKGMYGRRLIRYERTGPFYRQTGVRADGREIMRPYFVHKVLHATKGWRTYHHLPIAFSAGSR